MMANQYTAKVSEANGRYMYYCNPLPRAPEGVVTVRVSLIFSKSGFCRKRLLPIAMSLLDFPVGTTVQIPKDMLMYYFIGIKCP